jgi:hypothetical protein
MWGPLLTGKLKRLQVLRPPNKLADKRSMSGLTRDEARNMSDRWQTKRHLYVYNTHESLVQQESMRWILHSQMYNSMLRSMRAAPSGNCASSFQSTCLRQSPTLRLGRSQRSSVVMLDGSYCLSFSTICGTASNKSATNPISATWNIGASGSFRRSQQMR